MSRIGKKPITIPDGVTVELTDKNYATVKGPKGSLEKQLPEAMVISKEEGVITVACPNDDVRNYGNLWGLTRTLLNNMVLGVTEGFSKTLVMKGVGYRALMQGKKLVLSVGYSHPIEFDPEDGLEIEAPEATKIIIKGLDKQKVGALAADIRATRPLEPYKGKGLRYENETIKLKAGKTGSK